MLLMLARQLADTNILYTTSLVIKLCLWLIDNIVQGLWLIDNIVQSLWLIDNIVQILLRTFVVFMYDKRPKMVDGEKQGQA